MPAAIFNRTPTPRKNMAMLQWWRQLLVTMSILVALSAAQQGVVVSTASPSMLPSNTLQPSTNNITTEDLNVTKLNSSSHTAPPSSGGSSAPSSGPQTCLSGVAENECPSIYYQCNQTTHTCFLPTCTSNRDCGTINCDLSTGRCLPYCNIPFDCVDGLLCNNLTGRCVFCLTNTDCAVGLFCNTTIGSCHYPTCTYNSECVSRHNSSSVCSAVTGTCVFVSEGGSGTGPPCSQSGECPYSGQYCNNQTGECMASSCTSNASCEPGSLCDVTMGECVTMACASNEDCPHDLLCNPIAGNCVSASNPSSSGNTKQTGMFEHCSKLWSYYCAAILILPTVILVVV